MIIIGQFCAVDTTANIGRGTTIGDYVRIGKGVVIGKNCNISSYCEIRDGCILGDNVIMGSRCTLSAGTIVEDSVIMKYSFVVTDTPVLSKNNEKLVGILRKGSKFGANVVIMPGVEIGENSEIGACSQVRKNVPPNEVWFGIPAKYYRGVI